MKEIALHLLDIVQNSVKAGASHVDIGFALDGDGALTMILTGFAEKHGIKEEQHAEIEL